MLDRQSIGLSAKNHFEAEKVLTLLNNDKDIKRLRKDKADVTIMIIAPYKAQVKLVRQALLENNLGLSAIKVNTVDAFQGQEADIVIFSLVRTDRAGFTDE